MVDASQRQQWPLSKDVATHINEDELLRETGDNRDRVDPPADPDGRLRGGAAQERVSAGEPALSDPLPGRAYLDGSNDVPGHCREADEDEHPEAALAHEPCEGAVVERALLHLARLVGEPVLERKEAEHLSDERARSGDPVIGGDGECQLV